MPNEGDFSMQLKHALAASICVFAAGCGASQQPVDYSGPVADWHHYGGDEGGQRYSPLTQITKENVARLGIAWIYNSGDHADGRGDITASSLQVTPIVVDSTLYFCTPFNRVIALDPENGTERWTFDPELKNRQLRGGYPLTCRGVTAWADTLRTSTPCAQRIFTGTQDAELIALDARTGKPCADFGRGGRVSLREGLGETPIWEYYVTSPPAVVRDLVIVGALVADNLRTNAPPGVVRAFDARTGALRWAWDPVPPGQPVALKASGDATVYRRSTANVWSIMATDAERDLVFVPTGNAPPDYYGALRDGLDYWSSSVVALRASTGEPVWRFQTARHDLWDYDVAAQPTLLDFSRDGRTVPALLQPTKIGNLWLLDRERGQPLFPVEERPVPAGTIAAELLAPTQPFPTFPQPLTPEPVSADNVFGFTPWDRGKCRDLLKGLRNDGLYTPPTVEGAIHFPSAAGGVNWGSGALDPQRGVFIVNQSRVASIVQLVARASYDSIKSTLPTVTRSLPGTTALYGAMEGTPYAIKRRLLLSPLGAPCNAPPWGTLTAVDLATGKPKWEIPFGTTRDMAPWPFWLNKGVPNLGGPIVTASGLVFIAAATDRFLRAYDIENGTELWKARLPFAGHATPLTYRLGPKSRQYVVIAAGGHVFSKKQGDALVAFALH
jgi:quinoprotein glucose dehydrogenase